MPKIFKVGGCVRDGLLGVHTKDIDFTFVLDDLNRSVDDGFSEMTEWMEERGFEIFLSTKDCFTIRAKFPDTEGPRKNMVADFVMARKEVGYIEGTRKPKLELGTLEDDLIRRDFTVNAMAMDDDDNIIDLFDGRKHLDERLLETPLDPMITFMDDPLRMLRAIRFSVTKNLHISDRVWEAMAQKDLIDKLRETVSVERIRDEIIKAMRVDTVGTLRLLSDVDNHAPGFLEASFAKGLWLKPTFEKP